MARHPQRALTGRSAPLALADAVPQTVATVHEHHADPIKGSRFLARIYPVKRASDADRILGELRAREPDATHHCWAWRLRNGEARSSDDGEPAGSAGRPILARLEGQDWIDTLVVVTRWYGGTKLGVGGLIRAYGGTTTDALASAPAIPWLPLQTVRITCDYGDSGTVEGVLVAHDVRPSESTWEARITHVVAIHEDHVDALVHDLVEATAGRASAERTSD